MPYNGNQGTFTMFTSKRTHNVLEPIASNTSSEISPVGSIFAGEGEGGGAKSRGMGGKFFVFEPGESGRVSLLLSMVRLDVASLIFAEASGLIVWAVEETLYRDEPMLSLRVVASVVIEFDVMVSFSFSLPFSANESFDAFLVRDLRIGPSYVC